MIPIEERVKTDSLDQFMDYYDRVLRVAMPGIITAFNPDRQTVSVKPAIREKLIDIDGRSEWVEIPELQEVPLFVYRAGNYALTLPVTVGDECLVIFADMCIDAWWQSGGIQNQVERRRHDLSDAFAILGFTSQVKKLGGYSTGTAQLRTLGGGSYIELADGTINIVGDVNITGHLTTSENAIIKGISIESHVHSGVMSGGSTTRGPK